MKTARNWKRFLAFIIDLALIEFIITKPLSNLVKEEVLEGFSSIKEVMGLMSSKDLILISVAMGILTLLYWAVLEYKIGQTLGGLIFNLRMKTEDNKKISFYRALIRNLTKVNLALLLIDGIGILTSVKKQRFLERISKTITVEAE